jgi:hypothetical protein
MACPEHRIEACCHQQAVALQSPARPCCAPGFCAPGVSVSQLGPACQAADGAQHHSMKAWTWCWLKRPKAPRSLKCCAAWASDCKLTYPWQANILVASLLFRVASCMAHVLQQSGEASIIQGSLGPGAPVQAGSAPSLPRGKLAGTPSRVKDKFFWSHSDDKAWPEETVYTRTHSKAGCTANHSQRLALQATAELHWQGILIFLGRSRDRLNILTAAVRCVVNLAWGWQLTPGKVQRRSGPREMLLCCTARCLGEAGKEPLVPGRSHANPCVPFVGRNLRCTHVAPKSRASSVRVRPSEGAAEGRSPVQLSLAAGCRYP